MILRLDRRAAFALATLLLAGCPSTVPRGQAGDAKVVAATAEVAAKAAEAELDKDPLSAERARDAGEKLLAAGRAGRAHALFLYARALVDDPLPAAGGGAAAAPKDAGALPALLDERALVAAKAGTAQGGAPAPTASRDRPNKGREEALRLYRDKQYVKALERFEKLASAEEPRLAKFIASCNLNLAIAATEEGRDAEAVERLWRAADADPPRRDPALYRDVARLERRVAVTRQGLGDMAGCDAALWRALRAAPEDAETLYLLARRKDLAAERRAWAERRLARLHPREVEAEFLAAGERVRAAKDAQVATALVEEFVSKHPGEAALAADLRSLVADKSRGEAAKDAVSARARFEEARKAAVASRTAFETGIRESRDGGGDAPAPLEPPAGPAPAPQSPNGER